jgi:hypothetical protein
LLSTEYNPGWIPGRQQTVGQAEPCLLRDSDVC